MRPYVPIEEMKKDEFITVFANLKAKTLGPLKSQGMVMCADNGQDTHFEVIRPPPGSKLGERINLEGNPLGADFSQDYQEELKPKKKVKESLLALLKTNGQCEATYNGIRLVTSAGPLKVYTLTDSRIS